MRVSNRIYLSQGEAGSQINDRCLMVYSTLNEGRVTSYFRVAIDSSITRQSLLCTLHYTVNGSIIYSVLSSLQL